MLAMFQVPNKFFEADGRVTDMSGADWVSLWGEVVKKRGWLTAREFSNTVTVSQMLPGGAAANALAYIGMRFGGWVGALAGYVGFVLPGVVSVGTHT